MGNMEKIKLSKCSIGNIEKQLVNKTLSSEFLGMGKVVKEFENKLSSFFNNNVCCVINGTAAIHLALQALGIKKGDEVAVPAITYVSTYQAISATGAKPLSIDVDIDNCTLSISDLKKKISKKTKAVVAVHYAGNAGNFEDIYYFCKKKKLKLVEDAAHAFGTKYKNKLIGSFGDVTCFSFDGIKNITSGEGGCVVSSNKKLIKKIMDLRLLGIEKESSYRYKNSKSWSFNVNEQGWRYHMSDIMAAIGIAQLQKFKNFKKKRQKLAKYYDKCLRRFKNIKIMPSNYDNVVPHIYPIRLLGCNSKTINEIRKNLLKKNIETGIHYYPNYKLDFYKSNKKFINTEKIYNETLTLPLHVDLKNKDISQIVKALINEIKKKNLL